MIRDRIPARYRHDVALLRVQGRRPSSSLRRLPEFLVIGAQRAGTSSMFRYLSAHPQVRRPLRKEIDYFSANFGMPTNWYAAHFPLRGRAQSFDCTPQYMVHPLAPERCRALLPDAKFVVLLRDPIERLFSQYSHMVRLGFEDLGIGEALAAEEARISPDLARLRREPDHNPKQFFRYSYIARSRYGEQLARWFDAYPRASFHLVDFDGLVDDPEREWLPLLHFLELRSWIPPDFRNWSRPTKKPHVEKSVIEDIKGRIEDDMLHFSELAGRDFTWLVSGRWTVQSGW